MATVTPYLAKKILDHLTGAQVWVPPERLCLALYTDAACMTEVTGGGYARQELLLPEVGEGLLGIVPTADVAFPNMPATTVRGVALVDALTAGNRLILTPVSSTAVSAGATFTYTSDDIEVRVQ